MILAAGILAVTDVAMHGDDVVLELETAMKGLLLALDSKLVEVLEIPYECFVVPTKTEVSSLSN
jgi:hypothetical protein